MSTTQNVRAELVNLAAPLRTQVKALDKEIADAESALADMHATRRDAARALSLLDPTFEPKSKPGPKPKTSSSGGTHVAPDTVDRIQTWLRAHANGEPFAPRELMEAGYDVTSRATLTNALHQMHEQGLLRLDRRGMGGAKFYRFAEAS
jgi:Mn-dependent DtxR family transcriptional regulator